MATSPAYLQTHLRDDIVILRAADDLRRGLPVVIATHDGPGGHSLMVLPAELADAWRLERLSMLGKPQVLISRERAAVLKIHHKGRDAVRLSCPKDSFGIRALADPTADLSAPMKGPFQVQEATTEQAALDEAALALLKIAHLLPAAVSVDLCADVPQDMARHHGLLLVSVPQIKAHIQAQTGGLMVVADAKLPMKGAPNSRIVAFRPESGGTEHFAILVGSPAPSDAVLVRLHSECFTGDALGSLKCDCGNQFTGALETIEQAGGGIVLYLAQEGRGIGLVAKLKAYALQDQGHDTVDANLRLGFAIDEREFGPAAAMLKALGFLRIRLLTNNPEKVAGLEREGIKVVERVEHRFPSNEHNAHYLATKRDKTGHFL
ncbi:GTP cyclohydrolase-2 [Iodidimonas gelatinilytica]|uniref:GTP cyclohydrolase-2 n=1 Tax=Iodidimonas gelatinilytica TaxID=1236966 RepID=A0A5A7N3A0_9PROT|nr:GTP cyclohydrolase II [Iodidimonas gelatinilytica]GER01569.1 GTP cyclohydrolase-2 [Iodidimonas gelatinilytica]